MERATRLIRPAIVALLGFAAACGSDDPAPQLVDVSVAPPGDECAAGGTVVRIGRDEDDDGALAPDEVTETTYVCNADSGPGLLIDVTSEPAGANCGDGGVAIHSGHDEDEDGELDTEEIEQTRYVCDADSTPDVIYGNLFIRDADDAAQVAGVRVVTGSIVVEAPGLDALDLTSLEEVGWDLVIYQASVADLSAPGLRLVGNILKIEMQEAVSIDLSGLQEVGRNLDISEQGLVDLDLSSLARVGVPGSDGDLRLTGLLPAVSLPILTHVDRFLVIRGLEAATISVPSLEHAFSVAVDECSALETLDFSSLIDAVFVGITDSATLSIVTGFPALTTVEELAIDRNDDVAAIDFPALTSVRTLRVQSNPQLPTCAAEALRDQTSPNNVLISGNDDSGVCP